MSVPSAWMSTKRGTSCEFYLVHTVCSSFHILHWARWNGNRTAIPDLFGAFFQPTTASAWTPGSRRTRRRALSANSASLGRTPSILSPSPRMTAVDVVRRRVRTARGTLNAPLCCEPPIRSPRPPVQGPIHPPPLPLPSAWLPLHTLSPRSWATKTTTPQRRTRTRTPQTRTTRGTTRRTTRHNSSVAAESSEDKKTGPQRVFFFYPNKGAFYVLRRSVITLYLKIVLDVCSDTHFTQQWQIVSVLKHIPHLKMKSKTHFHHFNTPHRLFFLLVFPFNVSDCD